ncbi:CHAT domain-containing protein [Actinomadura sp. LD22]|uniref:CHAT domain-containing protein n=1 Tax=Actinomadura physcomitrii TaxID=2650748 RepID=A0A6I4MM66_9ACTN|nr:CHAT domain-containing protein [Actinomadura physcomitrii]MWA03306.1 CHAT domain-containing protein [Actinomadura physcomitrii]
MSARHAVAELAAIWRSLPVLVGSEWPDLRARLVPEIEALVTAGTDDERHRRAGRVLRPLMSRPRVWDLLKDAFKSDVTRASDPGVADEADWPALVGLLNAAARDQWINAVFDGHPPGSPFAVGRPCLLAFTIDDFAHAEAFKAAQLDVLVEDDRKSAELRVDVLSEDPAGAEVRAVRTSLVVHRGRPSGPGTADRALFEVTFRRTGTVALMALFSLGSRVVRGMHLAVEVSPTGGGEVRTDSFVRPLTTAARLREPDLTLNIFRAGGTSMIRLTDTSSYQAEIPYGLRELDHLVRTGRTGLRSLLRHDQGIGEYAAVHASGIDIPEDVYTEALSELAKSGFLLFQGLFRGAKSRDDLRNIGSLIQRAMTSRGRRLQVVSDGLHLPWDLMYVADSCDDGTVSPEKILGFRYQIDHIPMRPSADPRYIDDIARPDDEPGVLLAVNEDIDRPGDDVRRTLVADQIDYWKRHGPSAVHVLRRKAEVIDALSRPRPSRLSYFYCHCQPRSADPDDCELVFTGYGCLSLLDLRAIAPDHLPLPAAPLVVLNTCDSATLTPSLYQGLVPYFLNKGARGVIGTETTVPAVFAADWARRFFDRTLKGESVGNALTAVRHEFLERHRNLMGLFYTAYCEGETVVRGSGSGR